MSFALSERAVIRIYLIKLANSSLQNLNLTPVVRFGLLSSTCLKNNGRARDVPKKEKASSLFWIEVRLSIPLICSIRRRSLLSTLICLSITTLSTTNRRSWLEGQVVQWSQFLPHSPHFQHRDLCFLLK